MRRLWAAAVLVAAGGWTCAGDGDVQRAEEGASDEQAVAYASPLDSLLRTGEAIYWRGEIDSAGRVFEAALVDARARADPATEANAITWLGLVAWRLGDYEAARRLGERALEVKLENGLRDQLFRSYNALGLLAWNESRYFEALDLYRRGLEIAEADADSASLVKVWTNLGLLHTELGDFAEARELLDRALHLAREIDDALMEGRVLSNLGAVAVRTGEPRVAIGHLEVALERLREAADPTGEQNALGQLGMAYAATGELGRGVAHLDRALAIAREQGLRQEEATHLEQLAELYREAGDHRRALDLFGQASLINAELGLEDETGIDLRSQAQILVIVGNVERARELAEEALAIHRRVGSRLEQLVDHLLLADLHQRQGRRSEAVMQLEQAGRLAATLEARRARAGVALAMARIAANDGDARRALDVLAANRDDILSSDHDVVWEVHTLEARAHAMVGDLEAAARAGKDAIAAVERTRGGLASGSLRTTYLAEREAVYGELVEVLLRLDRVGEALEIADAARGRALVEHLAVQDANGGASVRELAEEERQILDRIDELALLVDTIGGRETAETYRGELDELQRLLDRARAEYSAALVRAAERAGGSLVLAGGPTAHAPGIQATLYDDEVLLEYLIVSEGVLGFVATRDGIESFWSDIPRAELAMRIRVARELAGRRGVDLEALLPSLGELYALLVEPALESGLASGKKALVIVPHGELAYLPFAALRDPVSGRFLGNEYTLLHLPSATALTALRNGRRSPAAGRPLALAPFPDQLPASRREVEAVASRVRGTRILGGSFATENRIREGLAEAGIVHAATHGVMNPRNPLFSRLELAPARGRRPVDDGRLEVHELLSVHVAASLVFLSGCETGLGGAWSTGFSRGEDYVTLARAFLYAGAANVVATLWRVEDDGAAVFAESFYRHLVGGEGTDASVSVPGALAAAQRELMENPRYADPYYWAGYVVIGSGAIDRRVLAAKPDWLDRLKDLLSSASAQKRRLVSVVD